MKVEGDELRRVLEERSNEELGGILRNRDEEEWRPEVFDIVASILAGRGLSPNEITKLGPEGRDVVEYQQLVTVGQYFSAVQAEVHRLALEAAGLRGWVDDKILGTIYGVGVGTRLRVRAEDAQAARAVLEPEPAFALAVSPEPGEPPCPTCGSPEVIQTLELLPQPPPPPASWPRKVLRLLVHAVLFGFLAPMPRREWRHQCRSCGNSWSE